MSGPRMGPAMASTELSSLPLAPSNRDRLLRAGFRTLRDVEGVQPLDLSRGERCGGGVCTTHIASELLIAVYVRHEIYPLQCLLFCFLRL